MIAVVDALGREVSLGTAPKRVVSLVPSETESVAMLAGMDVLVGRTSFCVEPRGAVERVAVVGGTKDVDVDAVCDLAPDLVLANQEENARKPIEALIARGVRVHVSFPRDVEGGVAYLRALATLLGLDAVRAEPVRAVVAAVAEARAAVIATPVATFVPIWKEPWMTLDDRTFAADVLAHAGARNVFGDRPRRYPLAADVGTAAPIPPGERDTRYPRTTLDEVAARAPSLVLLPDEPYAFDDGDAKTLAAALPSARIEHVDGKNLFWYGARMATALRALRDTVQRRCVTPR